MINVTAISENICMQLLKLQDAIAAREDGCPTMPEINMQVRLISCLDKMSRYAARLAKEERNIVANVMQPANTTPQPDYIYDDPPPITAADAEAVDNVLDQLQDSGAKVTYKGKQVPLEWIAHNLFQFALPVIERSFAATPAKMYVQPGSTAKNKAA